MKNSKKKLLVFAFVGIVSFGVIGAVNAAVKAHQIEEQLLKLNEIESQMYSTEKRINSLNESLEYLDARLNLMSKKIENMRDRLNDLEELEGVE